MNAGAKLSAYAVVLVLMLGGGWVVGSRAGPHAAGAPASSVEHDAMAGVAGAGHGQEHGSKAATPPAAAPGGLAASAGGYTLKSGATSFAPGMPQEFHPDGEPGDGHTRPGPQVVFYAEVPSAGDYRMFLDFRHAGTVRTAAFTVTAWTMPAEPQRSALGGGEHGGHS